MSYNRYTMFTVDGEVKNVPFINLSKKTSDKEEVYNKGVTRLDLLSNKYYRDANYGWLILLANPSTGGLEFNIEDGTMLTIPFPLDTRLKDYRSEVEKYITYYGV